MFNSRAELRKLAESSADVCSGGRTLNSPSFAFKAVYGRGPEFGLPGRTSHPQKIWKGLLVDEDLDEAVLDKLNSLKGIEGRASCAGHDEDRPAYFVFRLDPDKEDKADQVVERLRKQGLHSLAEPGTEGRVRIVAAGKTRPGQDDWEEWWNTLPDKIQKAVIHLRDAEQRKTAEDSDKDETGFRENDPNWSRAMASAHLPADLIRQIYLNRIGNLLRDKNLSEEEFEEYLDWVAKKNPELEQRIRKELRSLKSEQGEVKKTAVSESDASQEQLEAGNYRKQHRKIAGLDISIENPAGSIRSGTDPDGKEWSIRLRNHYGYIKGTVGKDKDHLDCFVKVGLSPEKELSHVHIVNQRDPSTGQFDEHKIMIGWDTVNRARKAYYDNYERGWKGLGSIVKMPMEDFKEWMKDKKATKKPAPRDLSKTSDESTLAMVMGGIGVASILQTIAYLRVVKQLQKTPKVPEGKIPDIMEKAGLDRDFPVYSFPSFGNAAYIPASSVKYYKDPEQDITGKTVWEGLSDEDVSRIKSKGGMILYDPEFRTAGIMGHEAGHAEIGNRKWYNPSRLNQKARPLWSVLGIPVGALLGAGIGAKFTDNPAVSSIVGGVAGGGLGLATSLPLVYNERQATGAADKYLDQSKHWKNTKQQNKKALKKAMGTYILSSTAIPAILGGIYAGKYTDRVSGDWAEPAIDTVKNLGTKGKELLGKIGAEEKDSAPGIPDMSEYGSTASLSPESIADMIVQKHTADRAGEHYDLRLESPEGLISWALKKGIPPDGQKYKAVRTQLHDPAYRDFEGKIPGGQYGAGQVSKKLNGRALITDSGDDYVSFVTAHDQHPSRFRLQKISNGDWIIINTTPRQPRGYQKIHFKKVPPKDVEKLFTPENIVQAKVDGAAEWIEILGDKIENLSYRTSKKTGRPIVHSERIGRDHLKQSLPEKEAVLGKSGKEPDTVLRGEIYGADKKTGKPVTAAETGGLLNAALETSLDKQKERNQELRNIVFDVVKYRGEDVSRLPYEDRLKLVKAVVERMPEKYRTPPEATDPDEQRRMWKDITSGKNPLTREGIVAHPRRTADKPVKVKPRKEFDVYIKKILPGQGKYQNQAAGGFAYSLEKDGPAVGKVGTGLRDEDRRDMWENPDKWLGRVARVSAQEQFPGGALRAPGFIARHEDYPGKTPYNRVLGKLIRAKEESDRKNYPEKTAILREVISESPDEFYIDSERGDIVGITHEPTSFKIHMKKADVPEPLKRFLQKSAEDWVMDTADGQTVIPQSVQDRYMKTLKDDEGFEWALNNNRIGNNQYKLYHDSLNKDHETYSLPGGVNLIHKGKKHRDNLRIVRDIVQDDDRISKLLNRQEGGYVTREEIDSIFRRAAREHLRNGLKKLRVPFKIDPENKWLPGVGSFLYNRPATAQNYLYRYDLRDPYSRIRASLAMMWGQKRHTGKNPGDSRWQRRRENVKQMHRTGWKELGEGFKHKDWYDFATDTASSYIDRNMELARSDMSADESYKEAKRRLGGVRKQFQRRLDKFKNDTGSRLNTQSTGEK